MTSLLRYTKAIHLMLSLRLIKLHATLPKLFLKQWDPVRTSQWLVLVRMYQFVVIANCMLNAGAHRPTLNFVFVDRIQDRSSDKPGENGRQSRDGCGTVVQRQRVPETGRLLGSRGSEPDFTRRNPAVLGRLYSNEIFVKSTRSPLVNCFFHHFFSLA